jgi:uncharacterized protein
MVAPVSGLPPLATARPTLPAEPIGWPLLPVPSPDDGTLRFPTLAESVRQMIEVILRVSPGELLMRADFGAGLERMLHDPNTLTVRAGMQQQIATNLATWEPRIIVDRIDVDPATDPREVLITIAYRLRRTSEAASITAIMPLGAG